MSPNFIDSSSVVGTGSGFTAFAPWPSMKIDYWFADAGGKAQPLWNEHICSEDNHHVELNNENYFRSLDGYLMPTKKDQPPPDLKNFK